MTTGVAKLHICEVVKIYKEDTFHFAYTLVGSLRDVWPRLKVYLRELEGDIHATISILNLDMATYVAGEKDATEPKVGTNTPIAKHKKEATFDALRSRSKSSSGPYTASACEQEELFQSFYASKMQRKSTKRSDFTLPHLNTSYLISRKTCK